MRFEVETTTITKKPSRKTLLKVIGELQSMIGTARNTNANDRDTNGHEKTQNVLESAFKLCVQARAFDPPE